MKPRPCIICGKETKNIFPKFLNCGPLWSDYLFICPEDEPFLMEWIVREYDKSLKNLINGVKELKEKK